MVTLALLVAISKSCSCGAPIPAVARDEVHREETVRAVSSCYRSIMAVPLPKVSRKIDADACEHSWQRFTDDIGTLFWDCFSAGDDLEAKLSWWVDRFGRDGPESDLKLLLASPELFMWSTTLGVPDPRSVRPSGDEKWDAALRERLRHVRTLRQSARRLLISRFLTDSNVLSRYYDVQLWSERTAHNWADFLGEGFSRCLSLLFNEFCAPPDAESDYWDKAILFVLLAHATSRNDVLANATPEDMHTRFARWREWLLNNLYTVKAHPAEQVWIFEVTKSLAGIEPEALEIIRAFIRRDLLDGARFEMPRLFFRPGPFPDWPEEKLWLLPPEPRWIVARPGNRATKYLVRKIYHRLHGEYPQESADMDDDGGTSSGLGPPRR